MFDIEAQAEVGRVFISYGRSIAQARNSLPGSWCLPYS